jgi:hypothetical protein
MSLHREQNEAGRGGQRLPELASEQGGAAAALRSPSLAKRLHDEAMDEGLHRFRLRVKQGVTSQQVK